VVEVQLENSIDWCAEFCFVISRTQQRAGKRDLKGNSVIIRRSNLSDLEAVYAICLQTGDAGQDASALYKDPKLIGHIYVAPYVVLKEAISFVAEDNKGLLGYAVGAVDTREFEAELEVKWWPELRKVHSEPRGERSNWTLDELRAWSIHHPAQVPHDIVKSHPSHIHMNLLPRAQGKGIGSGLLEAWINSAGSKGVTAVHAGVSAVNSSGLKFWTARGFKPLREDLTGGSKGTIWCGRTLSVTMP
jgi:GNAT superfamily N-acetyltransferase